jgi:hypothetical protein
MSRIQTTTIRRRSHVPRAAAARLDERKPGHRVMRTLRSLRLAPFLGLTIVACSSATTTPDSTEPTASVSSDVTAPGNPAFHEFGSRVAHKRVCPTAGAGQAACHARVLTDESGNVVANGNLAGVGGLQPSDLQMAYHVQPGMTSNATIAIVDAFDYPNAETDMATYRTNFGLPPVPSFRRVGEDGSTNLPPNTDPGWNEEAALSLDMASAMCPTCNIILVETYNSAGDLYTGVNTAAALGASVVSLSWGGSTDNEVALNHPGVAIFASSGDSGFWNIQFPAASPLVTAVGGTSLTAAPGTTRGFHETAWAGAGSGCSSMAKPPWQTDTGCTGRTVADVSAVADTASPVAVFSSAGGGWIAMAGTSVATPIVASLYALTGHGSATGQFSYANRADFNDILSGSNGTCGGSYLCTTSFGYDGPTGNGSPDAEKMGGIPIVGFIQASDSSTAGGYSITAGGMNFSTVAGATTFTIGGNPATNVVCSSSSSCTMTVPPWPSPDLSATVHVQAHVGGKSSDITSADTFFYGGTGPVCTARFICTGQYNTIGDALFECDAAEGTLQLLRWTSPAGGLLGGSFVPANATVFTPSAQETDIYELSPPAGTMTTYEVCVSDAFTGGQNCSQYTLDTSAACVCTPKTCAAMGDMCGSASDGCGGTINCGSCSRGFSCSSNQCCPTGTVWSDWQSACVQPTRCTTPACRCQAQGGTWTGKFCM